MADRHPFILLCFAILILPKCRASLMQCSESFCRYYRLEPGCPNPSPQCFYNNATHSGEIVPSPTTCNCCETCFVHLAEGAECSLGGLGGAALLTSRCGAGLSCQPQNEDLATCKRMASNCHAEQDSWDERRLAGMIGSMELRPRCDGSGDYAPSVCVPGKTCFCQNKDGHRIFGETLYSDTAVESRMLCKCSRLYDEISQKLSPGSKWPVVGTKCLPDGNFNPIQCIGQKCFCVDTLIGKAVSNTAINATTTPLAELSCFDRNVHLNNVTYKTFCEQERDDRVVELRQFEDDGYTISHTTIQACDPDGSYRSIKTVQHRKICVDGDAEPIEDFGAELYTDEADAMTCKCARTRHLMARTSHSYEPPSCCKNGNYRAIQCRRGVCYCVNQDGAQVGQSVEDIHASSLPCYTDRWRQC